VAAPPEPTAVDLDSTAELPVLDPAAPPPAAAVDSADTDRHHAQTWVMPHAVRPPEAMAEEARLKLEGQLQQLQAQLRDSEESVARAEARASSAAHELEQLQSNLAAQLTQLSQLRQQHDAATVTAAERYARLDAELAAVRSAAEQRTAAARAEVAELRTRLDAVSTRAAELQELLAQRDATLRAREHTAHQQDQALLASQRAHAGVTRDLHSERERNTAYLESLQRAEGRRQTFQSVVSDLRHEAADREATLARLAGQLAAREARLRQQDEELKQRAARLADLEQQLNAATLAARQREGQQLVRPEEYARLQAERAQLAGAVEAARTEAATALALERKRAQQLEAELAGVRQEMEDWGVVLQAAQQERDEHTRNAAASTARVHELEQRLAEQLQELRSLHADGTSGTARVLELEADLRAAEESIHRLESQLRGRSARLEEAEQVGAEAPPEVADTMRSRDTAPVEPIAEGATRLLICRDGGREVVHMLGRKTSIGRTPDNDLQIEAKFISRHHAVILAGPVNTVIEDLNSTNGVQVNGQRVTRQVLNDGDEVVIGRVRYRFAVRRGGR
jgi:chromosome segregation ATPase